MTDRWSHSLPPTALPGARMPVLAGQVVATGQPIASQVGLDILARGGTAADAAIATAAALTVVEPTANGLGADAFAMSWDGQRLHGINASGRAPAMLDVDRLRRNGIPRTGWDAVTVPGCVSGWVALWKLHGTLPFFDLLAPAIRLAEHGFPVSPQCAVAWRRAATRYEHFRGWQETFTRDGHTPEIGQWWTLPDHARTLRLIAETEGDAFYHGELAAAMAADADAHNGALSVEDLASHEAVDVDPLGVPFGDVVLHELPPNGQGLAALIAAGVLDRLQPAALDADDPLLLHLQIEAMKLGFADAETHVADPEHMCMCPQELIAPERLDRLAAMIDPARAQDLFAESPEWSSTVYLCCADSKGRAVSFIQSNYEGFGSGIVVPGTGIAMQDRAAGFVDKPGHPNDIAGSKRPYHTIIPAFTTKNASAHMAFGVMGGPMQPQGHLQVLSRIVAGGWDPQAAIDASRWRVEGGLDVSLEPDTPAATAAALGAMGHDITIAPQRDVSFGGAQAILRLDDCWCGASDGRRDGQAVGGTGPETAPGPTTHFNPSA
ncbi:MAG: gamma-glutamyltransferase family protein [Phycisphaerales bacterium]|nr:gamma-glutamyltransferase family protein [Phycisphaerales bacterium]